MIRFGCPHCNASMKADEKFAGKLIACKQCGEQITIPSSMPPPRRDVPVEAMEAESTAEEYRPEIFAEMPPVRRPIGAEAVLTTNGDQPPQPLPVETAEDITEPSTISTTDFRPAGRPFGFLSTLLGLAGAGLFAAGVFYPLFLVNNDAVRFEGWRLILVQIGGVLLCLVSLFVVLTKRYRGLWVLGPGSLIALIVTFALLYTRLNEERGFEIAKTLRPGNGLLMLLGAAALLTLAAMLGPRRKRYEYNG